MPSTSLASDRPRIAFFAPLSPMVGGVVDYSEELLPHLADHFEVDVYTRDGLTPSNPRIASNFKVYWHSQFLERDKRMPYQEVIYQVGCSADHVPDYDALLQRRGISVLHELNLSGILGAKTLARQRRLAYLQELYRTEGVEALIRVTVRLLRTKQYPGYADYNMNRVALRRSRALIVHNNYMRRMLEQALSANRLTTPVHEVPLAVPPPPTHLHNGRASDYRAERGIPSDAFVVGSFGVVHESKRLSVALDAFSQLLQEVPNALYLLVGPPHSQLEVEQVRARGLGDRVRLIGHVEMNDFYRYVASCDLCLNLRYPSTGGSSSALIRLMSVGKATVVTNHAHFAELPDDICFKLTVGRAEAQTLFMLMRQGARDRDTLRQVGERARAYVQAQHTLPHAALAYRRAILGKREAHKWQVR